MKHVELASGREVWAKTLSYSNCRLQATTDTAASAAAPPGKREPKLDTGRGRSYVDTPTQHHQQQQQQHTT
jgi:hypothetical protein